MNEHTINGRLVEIVQAFGPEHVLTLAICRGRMSFSVVDYNNEFVVGGALEEHLVDQLVEALILDRMRELVGE